MTVKSAKYTYWPLVLALLIGLLLPFPAEALRVNFAAQGDSDKLTFSFDSGKMPKVSVRRTGTEEVDVLLPADIWEREAQPGMKDFPGKLVKSIRATDDGVRLVTRTNAFGFIKVPVPGKNRFVLQIYRDPIGARWKPKTSQSPSKTVSTPAPVQVEPTSPTKVPVPLPKPVTGASPATTSPSQVAESVAQKTSQPIQEKATPVETGDRKPFFAVPYSVRNSVAPPDGVQPVQETVSPEKNQTSPLGSAEPPLPKTASGNYPSASELRFKAVNKTAEKVAFAELAGSDATTTPVAGQVSQPEVQPVAVPQDSSGSVGGAVGGTVEPVEMDSKTVVASVSPPSGTESSVGGAVAPPPGAESAVGGSVSPPLGAEPSVGGSVSPPPGPESSVGGAVAPPPGAESVVSGNVVPPSETESAVSEAVVSTTSSSEGEGKAGGSVTPSSVGQPVSGQEAVGGTVSAPPTVVPGAPPPQPTSDEAQQVQQVVALPQKLSVQEQIAKEEGATPPVTGGQDVTVSPEATPPASGAESPAMDKATLAAKAQEEDIRNTLSEAQSMMFKGALDAALPLYENILKKPNVPDDVREETLYAVADIKKEKFKDEIAENFEEIAQAYIEAMNSNLRSNRVPRALLNLGLINLKVGNFPEAKAYFKLLQEKYPDDDNIPSISYYWGEYYYRKGDYKKAADQFQYLIQMYPEHELVKQAAFYLADALNRTGFIDQAFQIVDYIDKRWPDYYMENFEFLRLAGEVEMKLRKWAAARDHYFTFYNLNPEADGSDIVLARIGDIYIREGERNAAKQIYQKAVRDYPDKEGGLVAKMRLAEEGIYDEPDMAGMATVFDRPYNKRPENIYKEIIENYPDSPLAPIAQLKLAMWYAFHKKYPDALASAQDFIEKYPEHQLIARAQQLGDSVFALAVPEMVEEQRYGRIVRYWETYDFIGSNDAKIDDRIKLNVALSYWKVGQPAKALALIEPYLQKKQVPEISDEALGLAVNMYLDDLAWQDIADLVNMAKTNWQLKPEQLRQLDYARAMSLQNLGEANKALVMWAELAKDAKVDPAFRAYAMYYMAKGAMERQDLRKVFVYAQEALALLLQTKGDPEKIKDVVLMSIYATERSGRYDEALKWAKQYDQYIDVDNPEWASTRFKLAGIYRKAGAVTEWKQLLADIIEKKPKSIQAQLAKSALETFDLEQKVQQFAAPPQ